MFKNWDIKKHTITCIIIAMTISIVAYNLMDVTGMGVTSLGVISSEDGSGPSAIYINNDFYKVVLFGAISFIVTMVSYKFIKKETY